MTKLYFVCQNDFLKCCMSKMHRSANNKVNYEDVRMLLQVCIPAGDTKERQKFVY